MNQSMFIQSITTDDQSRIVVAVQEAFQQYLQDDMSKKLLKETAVKALGENFVQLEVSKTTFRLTVKPGSEAASRAIVEEEIAKSIEMAVAFLNQFGQ